VLVWLGKQGEIDKASYEIAEKEKREFVGDGFIKCHANFQDFKEGSTYWLEYIGNDNYNVRSDNLLGKIYHITPCQLYTIFKKQTWFEMQDEQKPQGKTALEAINEEKVANANKVEPKDYSSIDPHFGKPIDKVEPKFKAGDWVTDGYLHCKISDVLDDRYIVDTKFAKRSAITFNRENNYHLWTIQDAKAGDVLVYNNSIFIFNEIYKNCLIYYGIYENDKFYDDKCYSYLDLDTIDSNIIHPATKEQRDFLFQKIKEAGYKWDADKKELRKIEKSHTNKVGPKFKVGNWIIGKATNNEPRQISEITDQCYKSTYAGQYGFSFEDGLHLWSIKDVKDGDIIYSKHNTESFEWIGIFKSLDKENKGVHCYGFWNNVTETFTVCGNEIFVLYDDFSPATKEQRDTLMKAMASAGYTFDFDKKELKKVEQKPSWSEDDEKKRNLLIDILNVNYPNGVFKVNPANTLNMEAMHVEELIDWLKSLKPQNTWKPSDAQMIALNDIILNGNLSNANERILKSLQEQLMKLKE
jgi:hypothetical protein